MLPKGSSISGQVVDVGGAAVAGAGVWVKVVEQVGPAPSGYRDEDGNFTIHGLMKGSATIFARAKSSSPRASMQVLVESEELDDILIRLPASTEARGKVVFSGVGVWGYHVDVSTPAASCKAATDESGAFSCWLDAGEGYLDYQVKDHQEAVVATTDALIGQAVEIEVPVWTISGTVASSEEGPCTVSAEAVVEGQRVPTPIGIFTDLLRVRLDHSMSPPGSGMLDSV